MGIEVKNVFYTYSPKTSNATLALNDVSLTIENNSFVAFVGETGSGKSTLVQTFNALLTPTQGEVVVDDFVITSKVRKNKRIKELRKHIGVVFQFPEYQLFEETVEKDVAFGVKNFGASNEKALEKAHKALLSVGLDSSYFERSPFDLSGGEKRRVAIAGILAIEPDILVLDEPTAGLDPVGVSDIMSIVKKMHEDGKTIILVTHDMDLVMKHCQKVYVLNKGKLAFQGNPYQLFAEDNETLGIEVPALFELARKLKNKGLKIDVESIRNVDDFVKQYLEAKK